MNRFVHQPKVYLVFWGSQWGTGTPQSGFSNDAAGEAPLLQKLYEGIGSKVADSKGNLSPEKYSNTLTWYCQNIPSGSDGLDSKTGCPSKDASRHVGYPTNGALAGVWADTAIPTPTSATLAQIGLEADRAAQHFADTDTASQFVIASPSGTHPDGLPSSTTCAWHYYTYSAPIPVAYTNLPYLPDAGSFCGAGFVNGANGPNDGVTIIAGHEYSESMTDPQIDAWVDYGDGSQVIENGDKCAWIRNSPHSGANAQNVQLSTGTFPLQSNWMNSADDGNYTGSCQISTK